MAKVNKKFEKEAEVKPTQQNLTLASLGTDVKSVAVDAMKPYDTPITGRKVSNHETTKKGVGAIVRTDYK